MGRRSVWLVISLAAAVSLTFALSATPAAGDHNADQHSDNMSLEFTSHNATRAVNSDLAFWGDRVYAGKYDGFRIFDASDPVSPEQLVDFRCFGPQNDPMVWQNQLLFLAVDRTLTGQLLLYVSSYPLRPGPTCGGVRGPEAGNSPLHEKISVISVPVNAPHAAKVIAKPKISYPGDPDNTFDRRNTA